MLRRLLIERLQDTQSHINIVSFEFNLERVADALLEAYERGVAVRFVTDDEIIYGLHEDREPGHGHFARLEAAGIEVRDDGRQALMHNKFWIFDGATNNASVWTGSTNITENGTQRNNNNVVTFDSPAVAQVFQAEFDELWDGHFGPDSPSQIASQSLELDGIPVEILFGPEDNVADRITDLLLHP